MTVQFAVGSDAFGGREPLAVGRGGRVERYLHARIGDTGALTTEQRAELDEWLGTLGVDSGRCGPEVTVAFDGDGSHVLLLSVDAAPVEVPVPLAAAPAWLRSAVPANAPAARPARRSAARGDG